MKISNGSPLEILGVMFMLAVVYAFVTAAGSFHGGAPAGVISTPTPPAVYAECVL